MTLLLHYAFVPIGMQVGSCTTWQLLQTPPTIHMASYILQLHTKYTDKAKRPIPCFSAWWGKRGGGRGERGEGREEKPKSNLERTKHTKVKQDVLRSVYETPALQIHCIKVSSCTSCWSCLHDYCMLTQHSLTFRKTSRGTVRPLSACARLSSGGRSWRLLAYSMLSGPGE